MDDRSMLILNERRSRLWRAAWVALASAAAVLILPLLFGFVSVPYAVAVGMLVFSRMARGTRIVLWLRRFHRRDPQRLRFNTVLARAGFGLFSAVTVQDTAFRTSYLSAMGLMLLLPAYFGFGFLAVLIIGLTVFFWLSAIMMLGDTGSALLSSLAAAAFLVLYGVWGKRLLDARGFTMLKPETAEREAGRLLDRMRQGRGTLHGVSILKCGDAFWQAVVALCLRRADAVLIDVSELNPNMAWELSRAYANRPAETLMLCCAEPDDAARARGQLPAPVRAELERLIDAGLLARSPVYLYPPRQPPVGPARGRLYRDQADALRLAIARALSHAGGNSGDGASDPQSAATR